jgi:hypothetical protein
MNATLDSLAAYRAGQEVKFVPHHAEGDSSHPDVTHGIVDSVSAFFVFVIFDGKRQPEACSPDQLRICT